MRNALRMRAYLCDLRIVVVLFALLALGHKCHEEERPVKPEPWLHQELTEP